VARNGRRTKQASSNKVSTRKSNVKRKTVLVVYDVISLCLQLLTNLKNMFDETVLVKCPVQMAQQLFQLIWIQTFHIKTHPLYNRRHGNKTTSVSHTHNTSLTTSQTFTDDDPSSASGRLLEDALCSHFSHLHCL